MKYGNITKARIIFIVLAIIFFLTNHLLATGMSGGIPTDGLIAYYPFEGDFSDHSIFARTSSNNGVYFTSDRFGNAYKAANFNGSSYINTNWIPEQMNEISMSAWIKASEIYWDNMIISCGRDTGSPYGGFIMHVYNSYYFGGYVDTSNPGNRDAHWGPISLNTWYHGVFTYNGSVTKFYLNGDLVDTETFSTSMPVLAGPENVLIGMMGAGFNRYHWHGIIDDIRIYNRELSDQEVLALFNEPNPLQPPQITGNLFPIQFSWNTVNQTIDLDEYFSGSNLSFSMFGNNMISANTLDGNILSLVPNQDWFGTEYITIRATNSIGYVEQTLKVTVIQTWQLVENFNHEGNLPENWSTSHAGTTDYPWQPVLIEAEDYAMKTTANTGRTANERLFSPTYNLSNYKDIVVFMA